MDDSFDLNSTMLHDATAVVEQEQSQSFEHGMAQQAATVDQSVSGASKNFDRRADDVLDALQDADPGQGIIQAAEDWKQAGEDTVKSAADRINDFISQATQLAEQGVPQDSLQQIVDCALQAMQDFLNGVNEVSVDTRCEIDQALSEDADEETLGAVIDQATDQTEALKQDFDRQMSEQSQAIDSLRVQEQDLTSSRDAERDDCRDAQVTLGADREEDSVAALERDAGRDLPLDKGSGATMKVEVNADNTQARELPEASKSSELRQDATREEAADTEKRKDPERTSEARNVELPPEVIAEQSSEPQLDLDNEIEPQAVLQIDADREAAKSRETAEEHEKSPEAHEPIELQRDTAPKAVDHIREQASEQTFKALEQETAKTTEPYQDADKVVEQLKAVEQVAAHNSSEMLREQTAQTHEPSLESEKTIKRERVSDQQSRDATQRHDTEEDHSREPAVSIVVPTEEKITGKDLSDARNRDLESRNTESDQKNMNITHEASDDVYLQRQNETNAALTLDQNFMQEDVIALRKESEQRMTQETIARDAIRDQQRDAGTPAELELTTNPDKDEPPQGDARERRMGTDQDMMQPEQRSLHTQQQQAAEETQHAQATASERIEDIQSQLRQEAIEAADQQEAVEQYNAMRDVRALQKSEQVEPALDRPKIQQENGSELRSQPFKTLEEAPLIETPEFLEYAQRAYSRMFAETPAIRRVWEAATIDNIGQQRSNSRQGFDGARDAFWRSVRNDSKEDSRVVQAILKIAGFDLTGTGAPKLALQSSRSAGTTILSLSEIRSRLTAEVDMPSRRGRDLTSEQSQRRLDISMSLDIDHADPASQSKLWLDPQNLQFMFGDDNRFHKRDEFGADGKRIKKTR